MEKKNVFISKIKSLSSFDKKSIRHTFENSEIEDGINILEGYLNDPHALLQICIEGIDSLPYPIWLYLVTILKGY